MYNRISIVGGSGTGKSTLAKMLSQKFNLPVVHLDSINYLPNWEPINKNKRHCSVDNWGGMPEEKILIVNKQKDLNNWVNTL